MAVIHEEVHFRPLVLDVTAEYFRVRRLEHDFLETERIDDFRWDMSSPCLHVLGNTL